MGSTRLPGKVMKILCGKTILSHVIERVKACKELDEVVVATSESSADKKICVESEKNGVRCVCGSEEDVLARYHLAAATAQADVIVRVTSDCPLFDPEVLGKMIRLFKKNKADYLSNTLKRTFPRGLDAEIFTRAALEEAFKEAKTPSQREHVTPFFYQNPKRFKLFNYEGETDISSHRWTLDTEEDWRFVEAVYHGLYREKELFSTSKVLDLLERHPDIVLINADVEQKKV